MLENTIWDAYMMILNAVSLLRIVKIVRDSKYNFLTYNIVIYFIKRLPYISYNRYINRR